MTEFSVILPTICRETLLPAVESVINQTHADWRLFIAGHRDGITSILKDVPDPEDTRLIIVDYKQTGMDFGAGARNRAIFWAQFATYSKWITYIDDDDRWLPTHLETIAAAIKEDPSINMLHTSGVAFKLSRRSPRKTKYIVRQPIYSEPLTVGQAHTVELFNKTEGWQNHDNHDHTLWKDMAKAGGKSKVINKITYHFDRSKRSK